MPLVADVLSIWQTDQKNQKWFQSIKHKVKLFRLLTWTQAFQNICSMEFKHFQCCSRMEYIKTCSIVLMVVKKVTENQYIPFLEFNHMIQTASIEESKKKHLFLSKCSTCKAVLDKHPISLFYGLWCDAFNLC